MVVTQLQRNDSCHALGSEEATRGGSTWESVRKTVDFAQARIRIADSFNQRAEVLAKGEK